MKTKRKKFSIFLYAMIALLTTGATFSPLANNLKVFAQADVELSPLDGPSLGDTRFPSLKDSSNSGGGGAGVDQSNIGAGAGAVGSNDQANPNGNAQKMQGCLNFSLVGGLEFNPEACIANLVYIIMWIFSWVLWLSGKILDMSIYYTLNMGGLMTHMPVVDIGWKIFRDLANIFFIFALLWIAISTIIGLNSGKTKELLLNLIIVALLMNFSLFITKTVIDGSNIIALHFYNLIVTPNPTPNGTATQSAISAITPTSSFSGAFMEGLKIQSIYQPQTVGGQTIANSASNGYGAATLASLAQAGGQVLNMGKVILIGLFGIALMLVASYVFFVAAILFIIRAVVLMMVMLLSPLAFLAYALPGMEKYFEMWKEKLFSQAMFAPIYLALCFVVIKTIQSPAFRTGVMSVNSSDTIASAASLFNNDGSTGGLAFVFNFILLIGLMLGSILVAKKMEAVGVEKAVDIGKAAGGFLGRNIMRGKYVTVAGGTVGYGARGVGAIVGRIPGLKNVGDKISGFGKKTIEGTDKLQKKIDIGELDKKFKDSKFGATTIGSFIREKTTGGELFGVKAKFGGEKTVHEAYEEDEKLKSRRFALENVGLAKDSLAELNKAKLALADAEQKNDKNAVTIAKDAMKKAESKLSSNLSRVTAEDFARLDEHEVMALAKYANLKQLKAVLASENWTEPEKREMIGARWKDEIEQYKEYQIKVDEYDAKQKTLREAVIAGKLKIDGETGEISKNQISIDPTDGKRYAKDAAGTRWEAPEKKPELPSNLKSWARNKMTLPEYEMAASVAPQMFDIKELVHTMRWGLTNKEIRTNENFSFDLRDRLTYDKDSDIDKVVKDSRSTSYIKSDAEKDADAAEATLIASTPNATPEAIEKTRKVAMENSVTRKAAFDSAKQDADAAEVTLKTANPNATSQEIWEARNKAFKDAYAKGTIADTLRRNIALSWKSGRASNELAGARGRTRNSEIVHSLIDEGIVQHFKEKDSEDITALFEDVLKAYKAEQAGTGLVTDENRRLIKYLFTDPRSRTIPRPIEALPADLKEIYEKLDHEGEQTKNIAFNSDKWRRP